MEFSRQEYWSRLPFPLPGDLPDPGIKLESSVLQVDSLPLGVLNYKDINNIMVSLHTLKKVIHNENSIRA